LIAFTEVGRRTTLMATVAVYNMQGAEVGKMDLNDAIFGVEVNEHLVKMVVTAHLAAERQGTQKAKTRSEVSGGGRKPWKQKGTGHARQGSTRAPQWTIQSQLINNDELVLLYSAGQSRLQSSSLLFLVQLNGVERNQVRKQCSICKDCKCRHDQRIRYFKVQHCCCY